jgi:hypothetical protein
MEISSLRLELIKKICLKKRLVNSISILDDGLYYTSALDNGVYLYDMVSGRETSVIDVGCGFGKYKFREPVHVLAYKESADVHLIVSDWHNHRLIKYANGKYVTELGIFESSKSTLKSVLKFIKGLSNAGQYIQSHFNGTDIRYKVKTNFLSNLSYFISSSFRLLSKRFYKINKPNGACLFNNGILFTQKNNLCLTQTDLNLNPILDYKVPEKGRLGNVSTSFNKTVFCVESIGKVFNINQSGIIEALSLQALNIEFKPFSACYLTHELLAIISMSHLHVFNVVTGEEVTRYFFEGELHGLETKGEFIYVSDRLYAKVYQMRLSND